MVRVQDGKVGVWCAFTSDYEIYSPMGGEWECIAYNLPYGFNLSENSSPVPELNRASPHGFRSLRW